MNVKNIEIIEAEMREIISLIQKWDYEYYILDNPSVEDAVYDKKVNHLKELEFKCNFVLPNSPTKKMNEKIVKGSQFRLVKRVSPMLSIDNVGDYEGLLDFDKRIKKDLSVDRVDYVCELKIDGLSASLVYNNSKISQISTRGNGYIGEDVTFNKLMIKDVPSQIPHDFCEIRGEIYMQKSEFERINRDLEKNGFNKLSNPRNAASGTLRTLFPRKDERKRNLNFFAYQYFLPEVSTQLETLEILEKDGFIVSEYKLCRNIDEVWEFAQNIEFKRDDLDFSIDGIVVKVNEFSHQKKLGENNKFPRWAVAYKFTSQVVTSKLRAITTEVSKNGRVTYVAAVDPVRLDGSVINNITLHNFAFIQNKLINIGDEIVIKKAGDVVPQVSQVIKKDGDRTCWEPSSDCPSCWQKLIWNDNNLYQLCLNYQCQQKIINYLTFFASKPAINIKGVSKAIVEKLYNADLVRHPHDFYLLREKRDRILLLENFKEKSVENLLNSIEKSRYQHISSFVSSFSIPLLSNVKAKKFTNIFDNDAEKVMGFIKSVDIELIRSELGIKTAESIRDFFLNKDNLYSFENAFKQMIFISD